MSNFGTLTADIAPISKICGDSGGSGDSFSNHLILHDFGATTRHNGASPLDPRLVTDPKSIGDAKSKVSQLLNKVVTTVTSVTTNFEGGLSSALPQPLSCQPGLPAQAWQSGRSAYRVPGP